MTEQVAAARMPSESRKKLFELGPTGKTFRPDHTIRADVVEDRVDRLQWKAVHLRPRQPVDGQLPRIGVLGTVRLPIHHLESVTVPTVIAKSVHRIDSPADEPTR